MHFKDSEAEAYWLAIVQVDRAESAPAPTERDADR